MQQAGRLRARYPDRPPPKVNATRLRWTTRIAPSPSSLTYLVQVLLHRSTGLSVRVLDPVLELAPGHTHLPHVFPGDRLCLYYDEFDREVDLLADTVVPWITEWLYFYESWLATGEWLGGGVEHDSDLRTRPRRTRRARLGSATEPRATGAVNA